MMTTGMQTSVPRTTSFDYTIRVEGGAIRVVALNPVEADGPWGPPHYAVTVQPYHEPAQRPLVIDAVAIIAHIADSVASLAKSVPQCADGGRR